MLKNINQTLKESLKPIINGNISKKIVPGLDYISVTGKVIDQNDILAGVDATLDAWLTTGRYAKEFESSLAKYIGAKTSLLVNSGSSANLVAFYALTSPSLGSRAIKKGDEVITVANTFYATVGAIEAVGATPVFCDCDEIQLPSLEI